MQTSAEILLLTIVLGALSQGGGIYECLLVDRAWPRMPVLVQPARGGIDRKLFWAAAHSVYEIGLVASAWAAWRDPSARSLVLGALTLHLATRAWSFAYFIPAAIRFERADALSPSDAIAARTWVGLSRVRIVTEAGALAALILAFMSLVTP